MDDAINRSSCSSTDNERILKTLPFWPMSDITSQLPIWDEPSTQLPVILHGSNALPAHIQTNAV